MTKELKVGIIGGLNREIGERYASLTRIESIVRGIPGHRVDPTAFYHGPYESVYPISPIVDWDEVASLVLASAKEAVSQGAEILVIPSLTEHRVIPQVQHQLSVPIIDLVDESINYFLQLGIRRVGLLGTSALMTDVHFRQKFIDNGIELYIPDEKHFSHIDEIIYSELCCGKLHSVSKHYLLEHLNLLASTYELEGIFFSPTEIASVTSNITQLSIIWETNDHNYGNWPIVRGEQIPVLTTCRLLVERVLAHAVTSAI